MSELHHARRFPRAAIATPHHLASSAGLAVLASGGNAVDAAVAANLVLGVVTPYHCGLGGDLLALVWDGDLHAYRSIGRAAGAATRDAVADALGDDEIPRRGAHAVTVPGAVHGWFELLDRFGTRSFGDLAAPATTYAEDGFVVSEVDADYFLPAADEITDPGWHEAFGAGEVGRVLRQPAQARALRTLASDGPAAFYEGAVAQAIVATVQRDGGLLALDDLAAHDGAWVEPLRVRFGDLEVVEHPPPTQGVTALEALGLVDGLWPLPADPAARTHLLIEGMKLALADRAAHVADPDAMRLAASDLLAGPFLAERGSRIDPDRAQPLHAASEAGGTIYLCVADADGLLVSLIQSTYTPFGSGLVVPEWGINLHNRGWSFSLDPDHVNVVAPRKLPRHTLIPAMALREGDPALLFGTMGADGQAQTHLQILTHLRAGADLQHALAGPRWFVHPADGAVSIESRFGGEVIDGLRQRGHAVDELGAYAHLMGHANAIAIDPHGYRAATDPRPEGAAVGL